MDKKQVNRSCVTNMKEKDPIIKKYMQDYMNSVEEFEKNCNDDQLIVNFDITYPDGRCENFTCNGISKVFGEHQHNGHKQDSEKKKKCQDCNKKQNCKCDIDSSDFCDYDNFSNDDFFDSSYFKKRYSDFFEDYEKSINYENMCNSFDMKYNNCEDKERKNNIDKCKKEDKCNNYGKKDKWNEFEKCDKCKKECKVVEGKIIVYSYLRTCEDIELKGVPINLYKINGICPELVECKKTDCDGKVCFDNLEEGCYRVIELVNKKYFEKPAYVKWNEVNIDKDNKCSVIYVINKVK